MDLLTDVGPTAASTASRCKWRPNINAEIVNHAESEHAYIGRWGLASTLMREGRLERDTNTFSVVSVKVFIFIETGRTVRPRGPGLKAFHWITTLKHRG